jgi:hypothetical protein
MVIIISLKVNSQEVATGEEFFSTVNAQNSMLRVNSKSTRKENGTKHVDVIADRYVISVTLIHSFLEPIAHFKRGLRVPGGAIRLSHCWFALLLYLDTKRRNSPNKV